jgi:hypothetical protein
MAAEVSARETSQSEVERIPISNATADARGFFNRSTLNSHDQSFLDKEENPFFLWCQNSRNKKM